MNACLLLRGFTVLKNEIGFFIELLKMLWGKAGIGGDEDLLPMDFKLQSIRGNLLVAQLDMEGWNQLKGDF